MIEQFYKPKNHWMKYSSIMLALSCLSHASEAPPSVTLARAMVKDWVVLEQKISSEKNDWQLQQSALQDLIKLYQTEVELIEEELDAAGASTDALDEKAEALKEQTVAYQKQRDALELQTHKQAKQLLTISQSFPEPLHEQVKRELAIVEDPESTLRERSIAMLDVLKSAGQFNRTVTYTDLEQVVGGTKRQLRVLYLGLAQAFYLSGDQAGIGKPVDGKWQWQEVAGSHANISKAIAVYQKTARPELITLPVDL